MQCSMTAMVKAMKIQEVILKAASGEILWMDAADIIGISYRSMKRWNVRYKEQGYDGLFDRRMRRPSPKRVPFEELQTILRLYRTVYSGLNVTHFHEKLKEGHDIHRGYTFVKTALQTAGLVEKDHRRGKHRRRRQRRSLIGMMLHLDGSTHEWLPALAGVFFDLLVLMDDATGEVYEWALVDEEDTLGCMELLRDCIAARGVFCSLYSDRAGHFFFTPQADGKVQAGHLTQIGRALTTLGIQPIPAYSPQARGRSERINRTLQGRLPHEFRLNGVKTREEANRFLQQYKLVFNRQFAVRPEQQGSAFVPLSHPIPLDQIFSIQKERTVNPDNTVRFDRHVLQIEPSSLRTSFAKCRVWVHQHIDHTLSITYGPHVLGHYTTQGLSLTSSVPERKKRRRAA